MPDLVSILSVSGLSCFANLVLKANFGEKAKNHENTDSKKDLLDRRSMTSLWFGASGFFELTKNPLVWDITVELGYPPHFIYLLGVAKVLGVAVLLIPDKLLILKEWVFAGIFFDILFAFGSKVSVLGLATTSDAIVAFIMVSATYLMFRKIYDGKQYSSSEQHF